MKLLHKEDVKNYFSGTGTANTWTNVLNIHRNQHVTIFGKCSAIGDWGVFGSLNGTDFFFFSSLTFTEYDATNYSGDFHTSTTFNNLPFKFLRLHNNGAVSSGTTEFHVVTMEERH